MSKDISWPVADPGQECPSSLSLALPDAGRSLLCSRAKLVLDLVSCEGTLSSRISVRKPIFLCLIPH